MRTSSPRLLELAPHVSPVHEAAHRFVAGLNELDRRLKRHGDLPPSLDVKREAASKFWSMMATVQRAITLAPNADWSQAKRELRAIVGPWLWRSEYFNRAFHKPHGFAGDYLTLELIYALDGDACEDAARPAIVNCIDYIFATLGFVQALWERRRRIARLLQHECSRATRRISVLDLGSGSAPYTRDFMNVLDDPAKVELTLVDRDASAIHFCRTRSLSRFDAHLRTHVMSARNLPPAVARPKSFDVVISTALFDDTDDEISRETAAKLVELTRPGGVVAVAGFHPAETSRTVREWILDWPIELREEAALVDLFPPGVEIATERSENGALAYAFVWVR